MKWFLPLFLSIALSSSLQTQNSSNVSPSLPAEGNAIARPDAIDTIKIPPIMPHRFLCGPTGMYRATNLQSDVLGLAANTDQLLINPWGMDLSVAGIIISDNGAGVATLYHQDGSPAPNSTDPFVVRIPASQTACSPSSATTKFNATSISSDNYIWFSANFKASGVPSAGATVLFQNATITINSKNGSFAYPVPDGMIVFSPAANCATTAFSSGQWLTTIPMTGSDEIFVSALGVQAPTDLKRAQVTWTGTFTPDTAGVSIDWKFGSAVYSSDMTQAFYNSLGVKATHTKTCSYHNGDHAGTPENKKNFLVAGARGGGGSNYTGGWSATASPPKNELANPTGVVFNKTPFFKVTKNGNSLPAINIFVSEDGTISGWNPALDATHAIVVVEGKCDNVYKGVTMGMANGQNFLYATNFYQRRVDTYDENFNRVDLNGFVDPDIPEGFAPFGIRNVGLGSNQILVTYARQDSAKRGDVFGPGNGFVDLFDTNGNLIQRLVSGGNLNSPWGLAVVYTSLGGRGQIWVGNHGDGRINAYSTGCELFVDPGCVQPDPGGLFLGTRTGVDGRPLEADGLWDLLSVLNIIGDPESSAGAPVYFTAGISNGTHGLFGLVSEVLNPGGQNGDFVWQDNNGNGCQDAGEPGIPGVQVDLYAGCGSGRVLIASTLTDSNGKYLFTGVCAGIYTVSFHTPSGFVHTVANQNCNVGGDKLPDETDSDCTCTGTDSPCDVCVDVSTSDDRTNLAIDCGYVPAPNGP